MKVPLVICSIFIAFTSVNSFRHHPPPVELRQGWACPVACTDSGPNPSNWTHVFDGDILRNCNKTSIFDVNIYSPVSGPEARLHLRACSTSTADAVRDTTTTGQSSDYPTQAARMERDVHILRWDQAGQANFEGPLSFTSTQLSLYVGQHATPSRKILLAQSGNVTTGAYIGSGLRRDSAANVIGEFADYARSAPSGTGRLAAQICDSGNKYDQTLGMFADITGDLSAVLGVLQTWSEGRCLEHADHFESWERVPVSIFPVNTDHNSTDKRSQIFGRDTCEYIQVESGDGCWALAERCGISQDQLTKYNNEPGFCDSLAADQYVCCSAGSLPDFSPQPFANGSCVPYTIQQDDTCWSIANAHSMSVSELESRNNNTWGWAGCKPMYSGTRICLSTGEPPMPSEIPNAECGPQVPNTTAPSNMSELASLNPCPLNACCDVWGQCGISPLFCTPTPADTGAPGTARPGTNGCISNCGTEIVNNDSPPANFMRLGYYEAWNYQRPCLHMAVTNIDTSHYTHVHFAFGGITQDFQIDMSHVLPQFEQFVRISGVKRIVSFGGWAFSTRPSTYNIFRTAVKESHRREFAETVTRFVISNNLDGVDFDWEYPSATDIPGIPAGSPEDVTNYLAFLKVLRDMLPGDRSIAIAAPASYWYLKPFPIAEISEVVDYIVFMTYDLHGQWDYGSQYSMAGCPEGNCLRSHVNQTLTAQAFSMITKAGVPASKVLAGMALYGRSFEMTEPGCYGPQCTFTGPESGASPGKCTGEPGYLADYEIYQIIDRGNVQQFSRPNGDVLVYDETQWVSWMNPSTYRDRVSWIQGLNFGGTSDWAMDLNQTYETADAGNIVNISPDIWSETDPTVACYPPCTFVFPPWQLPSPTTISRPPSTLTMEETWPFSVIDLGSEGVTVHTHTTITTTISIPPVTTDMINVWNEAWSATEGDVIHITPSVAFPPMLLRAAAPTTLHMSTQPSDFSYTFKPGPYPAPTAPLPPPPSGSPASVHVTAGPPSPTAAAGELTGKLCRECERGACVGVCGCIGSDCPDGGTCVGSGCAAGGASNGKGKPGGDDISACTSIQVADVCTEYISSYSTSGVRSTLLETETLCQLTSGCYVEPSTATRTLTTPRPACDLEPIKDYRTVTTTPTPTTTTTTTKSKPKTTKQPKPSATCRITGWAVFDLSVGGGGRGTGGGTVGTKDFGFRVGYKNGPDLGAISDNSVSMQWKTLDGKELGLPHDIMWKASFTFSYDSCKARYEGKEYTGTPNGETSFTKATETCVVEFECESGLEPAPWAKKQDND